jgi:hypothetical protein
MLAIDVRQQAEGPLRFVPALASADLVRGQAPQQTASVHSGQHTQDRLISR